MKVFVLPKDEIPHVLSRMVKEIEMKCSKTSMSMAVSGGSLPALLGKYLITDFNWHVFLADERVVEKDSPDSNFKLINESLLTKWKNAIGYPINYDRLSDPDHIAIDYETRIDKILGNESFDVVFLGMGPDGHTCSLFPGHALLSETKKIGVIKDSPKPPPVRITLTFPVLNSSKHVIFVVTGSAKAQVLSEILDNGSSAYPAGQLQNSNIVWILDEEAGSKLKKCEIESYS